MILDSLARLSIYTLQNFSLDFASLLNPLLTPVTIPETLLVILLDWSEPWRWVRQIRDWIRLLHGALSTLGDSAKERMQEIMQDWEQRRRGGFHDIIGSSSTIDPSVSVPLGPGEWDEALGLPLCVVCHNVCISCLKLVVFTHWPHSVTRSMALRESTVGEKKILITFYSFFAPYF